MRLALCLGIVLAASTAAADGSLGAGQAEGGDGGPPLARGTAAGDRFVRAEGDHFVAAGARFGFAGANANVMQGELQRARFKETLAALAADGLTVARVWAFAEGPADAGEWWRRDHLFRAGPDGYIEAAYRHLDAVVAEAGRIGLRLIVTLGNNWGDYGGIPMYLRWAGLPPGADATDPAREAFYTDGRVRGFYQGGLARLLDRVNTVTGVRYVDDPAILSWELLNESVVATAAGQAARRAWIEEMAGFIKARDRHHLVAPGVVAYGARDERSDWIAVHRLPLVDYCDAHLYPEQEPLLRGERALLHAIDDRAQLARFVVGKPLVIGEFGFRTDRGARRAPARASTGPGPSRPPLADRGRTFLGAPPDAWFGRLLDRALLDGVAGALTWIYQPWSGAPRDFGIYTDRPDTDPVRAVLRDRAARFAAATVERPENPRLGPAVGARLLYDPRRTVRQAVAPATRVRSDGDDQVVEIAPEAFAEARFERVGTSPGQAGAGGALPHAYGAGWGRIAYKFVAPSLAAGAPATSLRIAARVSSELPGFRAPAELAATEAGSRAEVRLDGRHAGWIAAPPDDGLGAWRAVEVKDRELLALLSRPGEHSLTFEVPDLVDGGEPRGLCIYGRPRRGSALPTRGAGPIRVIYHAPAAPTAPPPTTTPPLPGAR